jgi:hypothetical protein
MHRHDTSLLGAHLPCNLLPRFVPGHFGSLSISHHPTSIVTDRSCISMIGDGAIPGMEPWKSWYRARATQHPGCNTGLPTVHADSLYRGDCQGVSSRCARPGCPTSPKAASPRDLKPHVTLAPPGLTQTTLPPTAAGISAERHYAAVLGVLGAHPTRPGPGSRTGLRLGKPAGAPVNRSSSSIFCRRATLHLGTKPWDCEFPSTEGDDKPTACPPVQHAVALPQSLRLKDDEGPLRGVCEKGRGGFVQGYGGRSATIKTHPKPIPENFHGASLITSPAGDQQHSGIPTT